MTSQNRERLRFFRTPLFGLLLVAVGWSLVACSNEEKPSPVEVEPAITQQYLFEFYSVNAAWGYHLTGAYIDNQGLVVRYDHSFERWVAGDYNNLNKADLDEKYIAPQDTIAIIDQATISEKFGLIESARLGELSERVPMGNDMGGSGYVCYAYDDETEKYVRVLLTLSGDFVQSNLSPEAVELAAWLESVLVAAAEESF